MPIARQLDLDARILRTTISGTVTYEELHAHVASVCALRVHDFPEIVDARGVAGVALGTRDLPRLAEFGRQTLGMTPLPPRAVIVAGLVHFGMARMFASMARSWVRIGVFEHPEAAEDWLDMLSRIA